MYTVKELADLAGVSRRTLHYYHEIGLLEPDRITEKGYRQYGKEAFLKLQQILLFREMEMDLSHIKEIMGSGDFDKLRALREHRKVLTSRRNRLDQLLNTVELTIGYLRGEEDMKMEKVFEGLDKNTEEQYMSEARDRWGERAVKSQALWQSYGKEKQQEIMAMGNQIYHDLGLCLKNQLNPAGKEVQALLTKWHNHIRFFYEPSPEILTNLADMYCEDPRFSESIAKSGEKLPEYMREGIAVYVSSLPRP